LLAFRSGHGGRMMAIVKVAAMVIGALAAQAPIGAAMAQSGPAPMTLILPVPRRAMPAVPIGPLGEWASDNDYPTRSLQLDESGIAHFILTIDANGAPTDCRITESTNSERLDSVTCELMMKRARFVPALDEAGKNTIGTWSSAVKWAVPLNH